MHFVYEIEIKKRYFAGKLYAKVQILLQKFPNIIQKH